MLTMIRLSEFEYGGKIEKSKYDAIEKDLQERLYILLGEAYKQKIGTVLVLEGWGASGKGELLKAITMRLDPRKFRVYSFSSDQIKNRPFLFRYWNVLPSYGEAAILDGSWYSRITYDKLNKLLTKKEYKSAIVSIHNFEKLLQNDRYIVLKYFLNLSAKEQKSRLKKAKEAEKKWMISDSDWDQYENYEDYKNEFEYALNATHTEICPWNVVSAKNKSSAKYQVMTGIISSLESKLNVDSQKTLSLLMEEAGVS